MQLIVPGQSVTLCPISAFSLLSAGPGRVLESGGSMWSKINASPTPGPPLTRPRPRPGQSICIKCAPRPALYRPRQGPVLAMLLDGLRFLFPGIIPPAGAATGYTGPARQPRYKPRSWLIADAVNVQCKCKSSGCRPR